MNRNKPDATEHPSKSMPVGSLALVARTVRLRPGKGLPTILVPHGTIVRIDDYPALRNCGKVAMPGYCYATPIGAPTLPESLWFDSDNLRPYNGEVR